MIYKEISGGYLAPEIKVVEMSNQEVLCQSTQKMPLDTPYGF